MRPVRRVTPSEAEARFEEGLQRTGMSQQVVRRLPLPFVAGSTMLLGLAVACVWYTQWLQQRTAEMVARGVAGVRAAQDFESAVREVRARLDLFLATTVLDSLW